MEKMGEVQVLVRVVQPATMAEYERLVAEEGASAGADTDARVRTRADQLGAEIEAKRKAEAAEIAARDAEILRLREEERRRPHLKFVPAGKDLAAARNKARRDAIGG